MHPRTACFPLEQARSAARGGHASHSARFNGLGGLLGLSGLPAIGFAVIERNNSAEAGNNRNYGSGRPHVVDLITP